MIDTGRIEAAVTELLLAIGEDPARPGLADTPTRVARSYLELFAGVELDPLDGLADDREMVAAADERSEFVMVRDIRMRSVCEHHLLPFRGVAHVAYVPRERIVGLGRLTRVVETLSARPQVQERLTEQIADALCRGLEAVGVLVVIDAQHDCVAARGSQQAASSTVTIATRGSLTESGARSAAITLLGKDIG